MHGRIDFSINIVGPIGYPDGEKNKTEKTLSPTSHIHKNEFQMDCRTKWIVKSLIMSTDKSAQLLP